MHGTWEPLTVEEAAVFFNEQKLYSREIYDPARTSLEKAALDFAPGYFLIRALFRPQAVRIGGKEMRFEKPARSYLLYNPEARISKGKIIPLNNGSDSIRLAAALIRPEITAETVASYTQFFGLISEGPDGPFHFLTSTDQIDWAADLTQPERLYLIGVLGARTPVQADGRGFDLMIREDEKPLLGKVFYFSIPAAYAGKLFSCDMTLSADGDIRMDDDWPAPTLRMDPVRNPALPAYHRIRPTDALRRHIALRRTVLSARALAQLLAQLTINVAGLLIALAGLLMLADLGIGAVRPDWSAALNGWLLSRDWALWTILWAGVGGVLFQAVLLGMLVFAGYHARHRPWWGERMINRVAAAMRAGTRNGTRRVRAMLRIGTLEMLRVLVIWALLLFALEGLTGQGVTGAAALGLRDAFAVTVDQVLAYVLRGEDLLGLRATLEGFAARTFAMPEGLGEAGQWLKTVAAVVTPLSVSVALGRVWRWSAPDWKLRTWRPEISGPHWARAIAHVLPGEALKRASERAVVRGPVPLRLTQAEPEGGRAAPVSEPVPVSSDSSSSSTKGIA